MIRIVGILLLFLSFSYSLEISIYHTSDVHGMYFSRKTSWDKENPERLIGGFSALKSLIDKDQNPYIILDSGDMFQGTPEGNITKGKASIDVMNLIGYSAVTIGNHDYDFGEDNLKYLVSIAKFPFLGANIYVKKTGKPVDYAKPWIIINKMGKKIAILGISGEHTKISTLPLYVKHLEFKNENKEVAKYIKEIEKEKPDAIIVLAHIGISGEFSQKMIDISTYTLSNEKHTTVGLARAAKKANLILGGHNHTGLLKGWKDPQTGTMICESYWGLTHVTKAVLEFDDETEKLKDVRCELIPLYIDETGENEKVLKLLEEISTFTAKKMDIKIGEAKEDINFESNFFDTPIGNFVTDITRWKINADIGFQNAGGVRNVINKGDIKFRDVYQVMPFENTIVKLKMKGTQIYDVIRDNLKTNRTSMYVSGITVKYKINEGKIAEIIIEKDGRPLDMEKEYIVATNNYLVSGGSGGRVFTNVEKDKVEDTYISVRDAIIEYISKNKEIFKPDVGRFIPIE